MATYTWKGTNSTSWADAGNWSPAGGPPLVAATDSAIIPAQANNHLLTNLDRTADNVNGLNLVTFRVDEGSTVQVGQPGAPLRMTCAELIFKGRAPFYYDCETAVGSTATTRTFIQADDPATPIGLMGTNPFTYISMIRGTINYSNTGINSFMVIGYVDDPLGDVTFLATPGVTMNAPIIFGGTITTHANLTTTWFGNGDWTVADGVLSFLYQGGGRVVQNSNDSAGLLYGMGGTLDLTKNSELKTFNTAWIWPKCNFRYFEDMVTGTINFVDVLL